MKKKAETNWPKVSLSKITQNLDNLRVPISKQKRNKGNVPYYGATGIVDYVDTHIFDEELLLIGEDGADWSSYANTAYLIKGKSWVNNHAHVLRVTGVEASYLKEYLNYEDLRPYTSGTTRGKLNKSSLMNIMVSLPSPNVQLKIAKVFSLIDDAIQKSDQIIQKTEELKNGLMNELLTKHIGYKKVSRLGDIANFIDYRGKTPKKVTVGVPLITAKNIRMGFINEQPRECISEDDYFKWMTRGIPHKGDILFTTEAPLGNVAQLKTDEKVAFAQRVIIIQPKSYMDSTFLKYLLMSKEIQSEIKSLSTGGTAKGIKAKLLKQIALSIVPIEEQKKIANILNTTDSRALTEKKYKAQLMELRNGLIQNIFSERIKVN